MKVGEGWDAEFDDPECPDVFKCGVRAWKRSNHNDMWDVIRRCIARYSLAPSHIRVPKDFAGELPDWAEWAGCGNCGKYSTYPGADCGNRLFDRVHYGGCSDWQPRPKEEKPLRCLTCRKCGVEFKVPVHDGHYPEYCEKCLDKPRFQVGMRVRVARAHASGMAEVGKVLTLVERKHSDVHGYWWETVEKPCLMMCEDGDIEPVVDTQEVVPTHSPSGRYECRLCHLGKCELKGGFVGFLPVCLQERDDYAFYYTPYIPTTTVGNERRAVMAQIRMQTVEYEVWHLPEKHEVPEGAISEAVLALVTEDLVQTKVAQGKFEMREGDSEATARTTALDLCKDKRGELPIRELEVRLAYPFRR
jgi:hypothetical protein